MATRAGGLIEEALTRSVIGAFFDVYNALGYGLLEHVYAVALERELLARGHLVGREVSVTIYSKGDPVVSQRLDMVIDEKLVVEIKSTHDLPSSADRQGFPESDESRSTGLRLDTRDRPARPPRRTTPSGRGHDA